MAVIAVKKEIVKKTDKLASWVLKRSEELRIQRIKDMLTYSGLSTYSIADMFHTSEEEVQRILREE